MSDLQVTGQQYHPFYENQTGPFQWPTMSRILGARRASRLRQKIKYHTRLFFSRKYRQPLIDEINQHAAWIKLFESSPKHLMAAIAHFLDIRWKVTDRFRALQIDLRYAHQHFGAQFANKLVANEAVALFELSESFSVQLCLNPVSLHEGFWSIMLLDAQGARLFNLTFAFLAADKVLIGSIQGGARDQESKLESIQQVTRAAHGLRPPPLLLCAFQAVCRRWGIKTICAIDQYTHVKGGWKHKSNRFKFDYQVLWQEVGGVQQADHYWSIPLQPVRKDLEQIQSKKRSQYKKRFQLMDELEQSVQAVLDKMPG